MHRDTVHMLFVRPHQPAGGKWEARQKVGALCGSVATAIPWACHAGTAVTFFVCCSRKYLYAGAVTFFGATTCRVHHVGGVQIHSPHVLQGPTNRSAV